MRMCKQVYYIIDWNQDLNCLAVGRSAGSLLQHSLKNLHSKSACLESVGISSGRSGVEPLLTAATTAESL